MANNVGNYLSGGIGFHGHDIPGFIGIGKRKPTYDYGLISTLFYENNQDLKGAHSENINGIKKGGDINLYYTIIHPVNERWSFLISDEIGYGLIDDNNENNDENKHFGHTAIYIGPSVDLGKKASLNINLDLMELTYTHIDNKSDENGSSLKGKFFSGGSISFLYFLG